LEQVTERSSGGGRLTVEKVDCVERLVALETEWRRLESSSSVPFSRWDWAVAWWNRLSESRFAIEDSMLVLALRRAGGELVGLAPMMITRRPGRGPACLRQVQYFGADQNITELRGIIALSEWRTLSYQAVLAYLDANADQWDVALLSNVPEGIDLPALAPNAIERLKPVREVVYHELPLPATWEELKGRLPRNVKESLRKCYNSLKRDGHEFELRVRRQRCDVGAALERFFTLHAARADRDDTIRHANVFCTDAAQRFLADVCERFADRGALRIFELVVKDRVVAMRIGFELDKALYLYYSGYDPEFGKYSVMTTCVAEAIRYAISQKLELVNLSTGTDISKTRWRPVTIPTRESLLISPTLRAKLAYGFYRRAVALAQRDPVRSVISRLISRQAPRDETEEQARPGGAAVRSNQPLELAFVLELAERFAVL
jgi:CelD/BcsL family acetyltransferase involved in cellulose biosynthesis